MAEKPYRWTVDVEYDWGGRTNGSVGLTEGIPKILAAFREAKIKALFFISTETLESVPNLIETIRYEGHEIGSHGHFHTRFKEKWRAQKDKEISQQILRTRFVPGRWYRAPKFYWRPDDTIYANPKGHVSLLKHMWFKQPIKPETILYLHPFDIVAPLEPAPNLFCRLWYSRPDLAYFTFEQLVKRYK